MQPLHQENPHQNPFSLFKTWFEEAKETVKDATTMALATSDVHAKPSVRMVLLKKFDKSGFVFFTNLTSKKGRDLLHNPQAALCFYWEALEKQIRIEGKIESVTDAEADHYFASRPYESQLGACVSRQSSPLPYAHYLQEAYQEAKVAAPASLSRPDYWSGFRLVPDKIEFWQAGEFRLHTRLCFLQTESETPTWKATWLYP